MSVPLATGESAAPPGGAIPPAKGGGPPKQPPPPKRPANMKRAVVIGAAVGGIAAIIIIALLVNFARNRNSGTVEVAITTTPIGASVRVNGEEVCVSDCTAELAPGTYQLTAFLDGYEPSTAEVTIDKRQEASVNLALLPQPQTVRILADLAEGTVTFDDQPAGALQDGQFLLENVMPGAHTVRVAGGNSEATFSFDLAVAQLPVVSGQVDTRNLLAILVSSFADRARVVTSSGPMKLVVNGQPASDAGPEGVDLVDFQPGASEMVLGEGNQERTLNESFGPAPTLTAFLKTDQDIGTLIVATNQNDVRVFLNNREYPRRTQRGQLRVQTLGRQVVRVAKDGFEEVPPQIVTVTKGSESRVTFNLKALPEFSSLVITGGTPGAEIAIDGDVVGTISPNGGFRHSSVEPGDRSIEIRRPQYETKSFKRTFERGQTVTLSGADPVLVAVRVPAPPPDPAPAPPRPPPAPPKVVQPPKPRVSTMTAFDNLSAWRQEDGIWRHRGEAKLTYSILPTDGVFQFTIHLLRGGNRLLFRGGRVRWFLDYQDDRNYALFEMDDETFWAKDVVDGKETERAKVKHNVDSDVKAWAIQIDVNPTRVIHRIMRDGQWVALDTWTDAARNFTDGKFGILVNGNDEVGLSDFRFTARQ